jgi:hypothetical protein
METYPVKAAKKDKPRRKGAALVVVRVRRRGLVRAAAQ